ERLAAAEDRHAPRVGGEGQCGLSRRVARADDVDVEPVRVGSLVSRRAVGDALAGELVEALDCQPPPGHAAGHDDRRRADDVAAVEVQLTGLGVYPRDRTGHEDLRAKPARLLERAAAELVP